MNDFLTPKSIAIIGATPDTGKVGYTLVKNSNRFRGNVFFVNPNRDYIFDKVSYHNLKDIKGKIDLAIIAIPAEFVKEVLNDCAAKNVRNVIIISSGFSESGNKGLQDEIYNIAKENKIRIIGPNTFGVVNPEIGLDTTFASSSPKSGNIAFVSQSGALWSAVVDYSLQEGFGFSKFVSFGNMIDIDFADMIDYLNKDKRTKAIVLYVEALKDGKRFMEAAKRCKKPIIALKVGKSESGARAALSHTGGLAGSYEIYSTAFKQSGIILVETLVQAFDTARFIVKNDRIKGNKTVIITNAGGPAALCADYCEESGLEVVSLPNSFINSLHLPINWSRHNPIDVVGDAHYDRYKEVLEKLAKEGFYDNVICILTPQSMIEVDRVAEEVIKFDKKAKKSIIACFMGGKSIEKGKNILEKNNMFCFTELKRAVDVLKYSIQK